jgi:hypothetical protein
MQEIWKAVNSSTLLFTTQTIYLSVEENNGKLYKLPTKKHWSRYVLSVCILIC